MARTLNGSTQWMTRATAASSFVTASTGTVSAWVRPTGTSPSAANSYSLQGIFADTGGYMGLFRGSISGADRIWAYNWDGNEDRVGLAYTIGAWSHVAWVHTGGSLLVYVNGSSSSAASGNTSDLTNTLFVGSGLTLAFAGDIAEVATWQVALTAHEIYLLSQGRRADRVRPGASAYWPIRGDGSGTTPDVTPNRRALTLVAAPPRADHPRIIGGGRSLPF